MTVLPDIIARLEALAGPDYDTDVAIRDWLTGDGQGAFQVAPPFGLKDQHPMFTETATGALTLARWLYPADPLALIANASPCSASWLPKAPSSGMWPRGTATAPTLPLAVCLAVLRRKQSEAW